MATSGVPHQKLKESIDICNRLRTDPVFNKTKCQITYYDSILDKYLDKSLCSWKSIEEGGLIPWSRVYYIKYDDIIIWDRLKRICIIDELFQKLQASFQEEGPEFNTVLTWNILSDIYEKKLTNMSKRLPGIIATISELDATLVCLQEVNEDVFPTIEAALKDRYNIVKTNLVVNNVVLMSKIPFESYEVISLNRDKEALHAVLSNGWHVVGVHLTSNQHGNASSRRTLQLNQILQKVKASGTANQCIVLGDFNTSDPITSLSEFEECMLNVGEYTYNVDNNKFARVLSHSKTNERLDRLFYRTCRDNSQGHTYSFVRHQVLTHIELSDHYPVLYHADRYNTDISVATDPMVLQPSRSALCVVVPHKFWSQLNYSASKWMPHLNILFPFFDEISKSQKKVINKVFKSFLSGGESPAIVIEGCDFFQQPSSCTVYAKLSRESSSLLRRLHVELSTALNVHPMESFTPHITIARCADAAEATRYVRSTNDLQFRFPLRRLCHLSNLNGIYYETVELFGYRFEGNMKAIFEGFGFEAVVGGSALFFEDNIDRKAVPSSCQVSASLVPITAAVAATDKCELSSMHVTQPSLSALHDIDIVVLGMMTRKDFMNEYLRVLKTMGLFTRVEHIQNAFVEYIKVVLGNDQVSYDIHFAPRNWKRATEVLSDLDYRSLAVWRASQFIHDLSLPGFSRKLNLIKHCAKVCGVYGMQHGYLPGISWAVLVAFCVIAGNYDSVSSNENRSYSATNEPTDVAALQQTDETRFVKYFCEFYSNYDFSRRVDLLQILGHGGTVREGCEITAEVAAKAVIPTAAHNHDALNPMSVTSPVPPFENTIRNMTTSSFNRVIAAIQCSFDQEALFRGLETTNMYVQCDSAVTATLFANYFDSIYLRLIRKFEKAGIMDVIGDSALTMDGESTSVSFRFYHVSKLTNINTVWCWLRGLVANIFGSQVYLQLN